jgi:tetratricopeptide (TPR) repeat protein
VLLLNEVEGFLTFLLRHTKIGLRGADWEASRRARQDLVLLNAIGSTYALKNDSLQARRYFLQCLQIDPEFIPARKNLAISFFATGEYELAIPELERILRGPADSRRTAQLFRHD